MLCDEIRRLLPCDRVQIWRGDLRQMAMHSVIDSGFPPEHAAALPALIVPMADLRLVQEGFLDEDLRGSARPTSSPARAAPCRRSASAPRSSCCSSAGRASSARFICRGALEEAHVPSAEVVELIRMHASLGVDFLARTTDANALSQNLSDTATLLARIHDPDELLQAMAAKVAQAIGCDWAAVHLYDEALARDAARRDPRLNEPAVGVPGRAGVVEWMERQFAGSPEGVPRSPTSRALAKRIPAARGMRMSSCVSVLLRDETRLLGILTVGHRERRGRFARRQISLLKASRSTRRSRW